MAVNDFLLFNTMAINRNEILAVLPQLDEKQTFQVTAYSKNGIPLALMTGVPTYKEALALSHRIAKLLETGMVEQPQPQAPPAQKRAVKQAPKEQPREQPKEQNDVPEK